MNACPRASVRAPRLMAAVYEAILERLEARGFAPPRARPCACRSRPPARRSPVWIFLMTRPVVHVIGAGLAGLAAAVRLAQAPCDIVVHEAARQAGGRCRSFFDETMNVTIDNGNHLLLSGNNSALAYLEAIGARQELRGPARCEIAFADMASGERWTLRPNEGRLPWWAALRAAPRSANACDGLFVHRLAPQSLKGGQGRRRHGLLRPPLSAIVAARSFSRRSTPTRGARPPRSQRRFCARRWRGAGAPVIRSWRPTACRAPSSIPH